MSFQGSNEKRFKLETVKGPCAFRLIWVSKGWLSHFTLLKLGKRRKYTANSYVSNLILLKFYYRQLQCSFGLQIHHVYIPSEQKPPHVTHPRESLVNALSKQRCLSPLHDLLSHPSHPHRHTPHPSALL